jgi:hypothetical protein
VDGATDGSATRPETVSTLADAAASGEGGSRDAGGQPETGSPLADADAPDVRHPDGASTEGGSPSEGGLRDAGCSRETGAPGCAADSGAAASAGPCDIYAFGEAPCVAAHSTVRALYAAYGGNLYQVKRASDSTTKDIGVLAPGGFADSAQQDSFCSGTTCTISIIYDQSPRGNNLASAPAGEAKDTPDSDAIATALKLSVGGHPVYAVVVNPGIGYRNDSTSGVATGDEPEGEYMVTSGMQFNNGCCFDYGNAEANDRAGADGTMEAIYFGNDKEWGKGAGTGPWVMADLENGLYSEATARAVNPNDTSMTSAYVTAMVKGRSGSFALKAADAQIGNLNTIYDGTRPAGYNPMKKQGAIVLGIGGDNSNWATGIFFEGCMTSGAPPDASDDEVQSNIVAAGYGR